LLKFLKYPIFFLGKKKGEKIVRFYVLDVGKNLKETMHEYLIIHIYIYYFFF
jgi:hypothetical protein